MKTDVRVVLVGDTGVGKTTLVNCILTGAYQETVVDVAEPLVVPPEDTPDHVTATIIDTPSDTSDERFEQAIRSADSICVVYSVDQTKTFERITRFWLPELRKLGIKGVPIILVGNRIDVRGEHVLNENLEQEIMPIMAAFREVETCVECSAKRLINVQEVFYFAFKSVVHPTAPLYDPVTHTLKQDAVAAYTRIFRLCDTDKDDLLSDEELNDFQVRCFNAPLDPEELDGIKKVVQDHTPNGVAAFSPGNNALTLPGFLFLHQLFIQRGRLETAWAVLRKFGYDDTLKIGQDHLAPPSFSVDQQVDAVELSTDGIEFLMKLFNACDLDKDEALNKNELKLAFCCSGGSPWGAEFPKETTQTNSDGHVTMAGWLAQWQMTLVFDPKIVLKYLFMLGCEDTLRALRIIKGGNVVGRTSKHVYQCYVVGSRACGKSSLLRGLIDRDFQTKYTATGEEATLATVRQMEPESPAGDGAYLIMREFGHGINLIDNSHLLKSCDLLCLSYDSSDPVSFQDAAMVLEGIMTLSDVTVPVVCVACKTDLPAVTQSLEGLVDSTPEAYLQSLDLPNPVPTSAKTAQLGNIYQMLLDVARVPEISIPSHGGDTSLWINDDRIKWGAIAAGVAAVILGGVLVYRKLKR